MTRAESEAAGQDVVSPALHRRRVDARAERWAPHGDADRRAVLVAAIAVDQAGVECQRRARRPAGCWRGRTHRRAGRVAAGPPSAPRGSIWRVSVCGGCTGSAPRSVQSIVHLAGRTGVWAAGHRRRRANLWRGKHPAARRPTPSPVRPLRRARPRAVGLKFADLYVHLARNPAVGPRQRSRSHEHQQPRGDRQRWHPGHTCGADQAEDQLRGQWNQVPPRYRRQHVPLPR